jgi:hypothetical protein
MKVRAGGLTLLSESQIMHSSLEASQSSSPTTRNGPILSPGTKGAEQEVWTVQSPHPAISIKVFAPKSPVILNSVPFLIAKGILPATEREETSGYGLLGYSRQLALRSD